MSGHQALKTQTLHAEQAVHDATTVRISSMQELVADHMFS